MNDVCVENCAVKRNASYFELKKGISLEDLPRYPLEDFTNGEMTPIERQVCAGVYLAKVVDHLQGVYDEKPTGPITYSPRGSRIPENFKEPGLSSDPETEAAVYKNLREKNSNSGE